MQKLKVPATKDNKAAPKRLGRWRGLLQQHFGPLALYLVGAIIFTWPLVLNLSDRVINPRGNSADVWQHLWNSWWLRFSLLELHAQPYYSPLIFWPTGANLYFHALDPLDGYLSVPLQLLFGLVASFNLIFMVQLALAGYAAYLLARQLTGNYGAALVAGVIYGFSPLESALLNLGQVELTAIAWLPFFMLFFIKSLEAAPRPWFNRIASLAFLIALSLDSWYYVLYALLFAGLYLLYKLTTQPENWRRSFAIFAGIVLVWAGLVAPLLFQTIREVNNGSNKQELWIVAYNSAPLLGFVQPGPSAIWGLFGLDAGQNNRGNFVGFFGLALALLGLVTCWRKSWFWLGSGLIFGLLALGPVLHLQYDPNWDKTTALQGLSLPGQWLYYLPFGDIARVPLRFTLGLMLSLAICAAFGLDWLMRQKLPRFSSAQRLLPLIAGGLIFLEFLPIPRSLVETEVPAFYQQLRDEGKWNDFAVLEMPDSVTTLSMYYQTTHQHPILNAYLSRSPAYPFEQIPGIRDLRFLLPDPSQTAPEILPQDILDRRTLTNIPAMLAYYRVRYVILHPAFLKGEEVARAQAILTLAFGNTPPYYQDNELKAWRVPNFDQSQPNVAKILAGFGPGWIIDPDNQARRSIGPNADLFLFNPYQTPLTVSFASKVQSINVARKLQINLEGQTLAQKQIETGSTDLTFSLILQPGQNRLTFKTEVLPQTLVFGPITLT